MTAARPPRRWLPWVVVAAALVLGVWNALRARAAVFGPLDDESLLVPIALRQAGLAAFPGDGWLAATAPIFSVPYSWIVGGLLRWIDDPGAALRLLSVPFLLLFVAGTFLVARRVAGQAAAFGAVILCTYPDLPVPLFRSGAALPRDLVFALMPWFVLAADTWRERSLAVRASAFLALGVLANLHPLTALHVALWLAAIETVREPKSGIRVALAGGAAFVVGAAPYVVQYLSRPATAGAVDPAVYSWRLGAMGGETIGACMQRMEMLLWLAAAATIVATAASRAGRPLPRWLTWGTAMAVVVAALGPTLGRIVPPLRGFQFDRFERIASWSAVVAFAAGAVASRHRVAIVAASVCVALALWGPDLLGGNPARGPIGRLGRNIDRRMEIPVTSPAPPGLQQRTDVVDPSSYAGRDAFRAVCRFARESTPPDALFLVPPETWGAFRAYARRGAFVTRKEGGAALSFLGATGMDWFRDYADVVRVYAKGAPSDWTSLAERSGASFVVIDPAAPSPPPWPVAFEAAPFRVLAVPTK